jgi:hypothetical protein
MTGAELKALIPDDCGVYVADGDDMVELLPEDVMKDSDGDIVITVGDVDAMDLERDEEDEDEEDEEIEVDV